MAKPITPPKERFESKVDKNGPVPQHRPDLGPCWLWTAALTGGGYGYMRVGSMVDGTRGHARASRVAYEMFRGPIPEGLQLDHLCRVRACVNPDHLEAVTQRVNLLRGETLVAANAKKTHCPNGHPLVGDNLDKHSLKRGRRICRACINLRGVERYYREKRRRDEHAG